MKNLNVFIVLFILILTGCSKENSNNLNNYIPVTQGSFEVALPIPPVSNNSLTLIAQHTVQPIFSGHSSSVLGYQSGSILGTTMVVNSGDVLNVTLQNQLTEPSNIHWHGLITPANMDGHPEDVVQPGGSFNYTFPISQRAGLYWYHPHPDDYTAKQAYLGLAGAIIVRDNEEKALNLPSGEFEVPLIIQDKRINSDYSLDYTPTMNDVMTGYMGSYITVNGVYAPSHKVSSRNYRFRILNGSNGRIYNLALSNGASFRVIGSDGGLLSNAQTVTSLLLGPGERADLLVDFSTYSVGSEIFLENQLFSAGDAQGKQRFNIVKFIVNKKETDLFSLPLSLSSITPINENSAVKIRTFDISNPDMASMGGMNMGGMNMGGMSMKGMHRINNKSYDKSRIDETIQGGSTEIWVFDNSKGAEPHPMHIHGVQFQILDRTGGRNSLIASEKGWKDTVLLLPGEKVRVIMTFASYKGKYMIHCHNLEHEDDGMMLQFEII
ncbi:MAG: multicopper oxidase family protein [Bacteroidales bacterium]